MKKSTTNILWLVVLFLLTSCQNPWVQPFQSAEIAYLTYVRDYGIGFIDANASVGVVSKERLSMPAWSLDGQRLYGIVLSGQYFGMGFPGYIDSQGELKRCERDSGWFRMSLIEDIPDVGGVEQVLTVVGSRILIMDIENCEIVRVLVDFSQGTGEGIYGIYGASYSPDGKWLIYGIRTSSGYKLTKLDLETQDASILAKGINPTWSPEGTQIAYLQDDGIYIINSDGSNARKLIAHGFVGSEGFGIVVPIPHWSPDGKWLIYHRCERYSCKIDENTIYKVDIATGTEEKIIEGGAFPDWRKVP